MPRNSKASQSLSWALATMLLASMALAQDAADLAQELANPLAAIINGKPVNFQGGVGRWMESPDGGPEDWRFRLQVQFVFSKG